MNQAEFHREQEKIYQDLCNAIFECIPEDWDEIFLSLENNQNTIVHELSNPKIKTGLATITPNNKIYACSRELQQLFNQNGTPWQKVKMRVFWDEALEAWNYKVEYNYI